MDEDQELERIRKRKFEALQRYATDVQAKSHYPDHPVHVTDLNFTETIGKYPTVVVDFWAPWCQPCKMVTAVIDSLSKEMQGKVVFVKLNVDENPLTTKENDVMSIPTMMIYREGRLVDRFVGAQTRSSLIDRLNRHMPHDE
jgi:thioredoxin 1